MRFTKPHRRKGSRTVRLWVLTLGVGSLIFLSAPAAQAECPLLDPGCLIEAVEDVTELVQDTAGAGVELVEDTVEVVTVVVDKTVEDSVEVVTGVVDETVDDTEPVVKVVTDPVEDALREEEPPLPVSDPDGGAEPGRNQGLDRSDGRGAPVGEDTRPSLVGSPPEPITVPDRPSPTPSDAPGLLERIGGAAAEAARQLSFPMALSLIVVAFVLFQNYLDRKDPKLAVAPIAADVIKFE
jgi:hypothetical protein